MRALWQFILTNLTARAHRRASQTKDKTMKKLCTVLLSILFVSSLALATQNTNSSTMTNTGATAKKKRGPVFRASKDQVKQAQAILKDRGFYGGERTGKLDADTRAGLKKYQAGEKIKVTGTLNRVTLEKMSIVLTDKQRTM